MTHEDKNNVISMVVNIAVNAYIIWKLMQMNAAGAFDGADALMNWARMVIWVIPISVVLMIVGTIMFSIIFAVATNDAKPSFVTDERDKLFGNRSMIAVIMFAGFGFISSIVCLAIGWSALFAFNVIYFSFALGSFAGDITKFVSYRRGY
jgi:hypothetical protein